MHSKLGPLISVLHLIVFTLWLNPSPAAAQQTTAFTYQGQLRDNGTNASGTYAMTFKLFDAATSGNQIGNTVNSSSTLANGLFTVNLDFGANAFNGDARWLDITVLTDTLTPRVQLLPTPYAQFAAVAGSVTNGAIMNAQLAASAVNAVNIASGQVIKSINGLTDSVTLTAGANIVFATNSNSLQISALSGATVGAVPNGIQVFASSGTFTVPANVTRIMVEMWGGGGAGGAGAVDGTTSGYGGGGGASGGYAQQLFTVTPNTGYAVVVGSGGLHNGNSGTVSSFGGTLLVANGGGGGGNASSSIHGAGGTKASASVGSLLPANASRSGEDGSGTSPGPMESAGGAGGPAFRLDGRGLGGHLGGGYDGHSAGIGAGGGGGAANASSQPSPLTGIGGDGGDGLVIITY